MGVVLPTQQQVQEILQALLHLKETQDRQVVALTSQVAAVAVHPLQVACKMVAQVQRVLSQEVLSLMLEVAEQVQMPAMDQAVLAEVAQVRFQLLQPQLQEQPTQVEAVAVELLRYLQSQAQQAVQEL